MGIERHQERIVKRKIVKRKKEKGEEGKEKEEDIFKRSRMMERSPIRRGGEGYV